jgi:hypothetical protein
LCYTGRWRARAFPILCGVVGTLFIAGGLLLFAQFFRYQAPGGALPSALPLGPGAVYFVAFSGCALTAWGGCLWAGARHPALAGPIATATAVGLVMSGAYRMLAWLVGDYALLGELPRGEAAIFLLLALAFVWIRPVPDEVPS